MSSKFIPLISAIANNWIAGAITVTLITGITTWVGKLEPYAVFMCSMFMLGVYFWASNNLAIYKERTKTSLITESPWFELEINGDSPEPIVRPTITSCPLRIDVQIHALLNGNYTADVLILFPENQMYQGMKLTAIGCNEPHYNVKATNSTYSRILFHITPQSKHELRITYLLRK